jgi:hypothetical protein
MDPRDARRLDLDKDDGAVGERDRPFREFKAFSDDVHRRVS